MQKLTVPLLPTTSDQLRPFAALLGRPEAKPTIERDDIHYHHHVQSLGGLTSKPTSGYLVAFQRPLSLKQIERHKHSEEAFIPLTGESIIVLGPPGDFDPSQLRAFALDGTSGIQLHAGTWHWAPFPLSPEAHFLLLLGEHTVPGDIEILDIDERAIEAPGVTV